MFSHCYKWHEAAAFAIMQADRRELVTPHGPRIA